MDIAWGSIDWDKRGLARGDVEWIDGGKRFLWTSERDGWRHIYSVSRDGKDVKLITPGDYDLIGVEMVDVPNGWLYFRPLLKTPRGNISARGSTGPARPNG